MKIKNNYNVALKQLLSVSSTVPNSGYGAYLKIVAGIQMNIRFEEFAFKNCNENPYKIMTDVIKMCIELFESYHKIKYIFTTNVNKNISALPMEERHKKLFQQLWVSYSPEKYDELAMLMYNRFKNNKLDSRFFDGKICLDNGCGNGRTSIALAKLGAAKIIGIDYGKNSITYAKKMLNNYPDLKKKISYREGTSYQLPFKNDFFDVVISNGVFHHMEDPQKAIRETARVLKKGGFFWLYIQGQGGIVNDIWDTTKIIMKNIPKEFTFSVLTEFGLTTNKRYHLMDGFYATYICSKWSDIESQLKQSGFVNLQRFEGGKNTDYDAKRIKKDKYGFEKFGEGEFRIGCFKK